MTAPVVLVVEDNDAFRQVLMLLLRGEGYEVREAADGQQGLQRLREPPRPGMVLLDLSMPRLDGRQFRAAQLQEAAVSGVPVVIITAHGSPADAEALGAAAFLQKPVDLNDVLSVVRRFCLGSG